MEGATLNAPAGPILVTLFQRLINGPDTRRRRPGSCAPDPPSIARQSHPLHPLLFCLSIALPLHCSSLYLWKHSVIAARQLATTSRPLSVVARSLPYPLPPAPALTMFHAHSLCFQEPRLWLYLNRDRA
jgi:hypothetical protein